MEFYDGGFQIDYQGRSSVHCAVLGAGANEEAAEINARQNAARDIPHGVVISTTTDTMVKDGQTIAYVCSAVVAWVIDDNGMPMRPRVIGGAL